jgi:Glycosyl transferase family 2
VKTAKDIVLTCCRDESDVIAVFCRFYLALGFDEVHVVDNGSVDGTPEIVEGLAAAGWPVVLYRDPRLGYERHLTEHYRTAGARAGARWLFFLDCDEFILFPGPVEDYLAALPAGVSCLRLRQKEMYPSLGPERGPAWSERSERSERSEPWAFLLTTRSEPRFNDTTKDVTRFDPRARVYAGKHRIEVAGGEVLCPRDLFIRHYKFRTPEQAARKERNKVEAHASYSDDELARLSAFGLETSRRWFEVCRADCLAEAWRSRFSPELPSCPDDGLARHAGALLAGPLPWEAGSKAAAWT